MTNRCIEISRQAHTVGLPTSGLRGAGRGSRGNSGAPPSGEGTTWQPTLRSQQSHRAATATYTSARGRPRPFRAAPVAQQPWLRSSHCAARSRPSAPCHNNLHPHKLTVAKTHRGALGPKSGGVGLVRARRRSGPAPAASRRPQDGIGAASAQPIRRLGRRTPRSPLLGARTRCPLRPERPLVAAPGH